MSGQLIEPDALEAREEWIAGVIAGGSTLDASVPNAASLLSIAISMKRIADGIAGVPYDNAPGADNSRHRMGLVDGIMHAIEQGLLAASNRG